jgi:hypothetical protein
MTESTFPFDAPGDEPEAPAEGSKRKLALVAGAGALAVAVLGYFVVVPMLSGSGDTSGPVAIVHRAPKKATTKAKAKAKPAAKPVAQPASYADVSARTDPFKPLIVEPEAPAAPAGVVAPPAGTDTSGGTTAAGSETTAGSTGSTPAGSASVGGQRVALVHVYAKDGKSYAQTKVGDKVYSPTVGGVFAGSYKLLATSGKTATYLFGDEQFSLSEGQEVLK